MPSLPLYHPDGSTKGEVELPESLFAAKLNLILMAQAVQVYLSNQRKAYAHAKTRGEVDLTTKKWFRQKGTGRARHGAQSASIFVGGGKAHGPTGTQNYHMTMPQKMRRAALVSALTTQLQAERVMIVDGLENLAAKTKQAADTLKNLKLTDQKFTLVMPEKVDTLVRAFRNLATSRIKIAAHLNTYEVLNGGVLLFTKSAIAKLDEAFGKEAATVSKEKAPEKTPKVGPKSAILREKGTKIVTKKPATIKSAVTKAVRPKVAKSKEITAPKPVTRKRKA